MYDRSCILETILLLLLSYIGISKLASRLHTFCVVRDPTNDPMLALESTAATTPSSQTRATVVVPWLRRKGSAPGASRQ